MKDIAKAIAFDREKFITNEDDSITLVEKLSCKRIKAIDDFIIKQLQRSDIISAGRREELRCRRTFCRRLKRDIERP